MRPKLIIRMLAVLVLLALIAVGLGLVAISLGLVDKAILISIVELPYMSAANGWITAGIGVGIVLLSILLISGINRRAPRNNKAPAMAVISRGEMGMSTITLAAIDDMVRRHCTANGNVKDCDASISVREDKLSIGLKLSVLPDANIAQTTSALRESLISYLQELTGITVADVGIMVVTGQEQKAPAAQG